MSVALSFRSAELPDAVRAFDALAPAFDERFGAWASVAAQRRAVRRELLRAFARGANLLEIGAGTGEDALFLAQQGRHVLATDGAPSMRARIAAKAAASPTAGRVTTAQLTIEQLGSFADEHFGGGGTPFDGVYSNFAAFNCVPSVASTARALARLVVPGGRALLVMFGPCPPGEILLGLARGQWGAAVRRFRRGPVAARIGGQRFTVWYPSPRRVAAELAPSFRLVGTMGIGIWVPPSAAEPGISRHPRLLRVLEALDRVAARPLALLGDHVLLEFERAVT